MKAFLHAAIKDGETAKGILNSKKNLTEGEGKYLLDVIRQAENARKMLEEYKRKNKIFLISTITKIIF